MLHNQMTAPTWNLQPGDILVREQIHGQHGGNPQAGISRSSSTPNVLVYLDHDKAAANGYDFDGWDAAKQVFYYTDALRAEAQRPEQRLQIAYRTKSDTGQ